MGKRWPILLIWDGMLPLVVASIPPLVVAVAPKNEVAEMAAFAVVPAVAALIRTASGARQIRLVNHGQLPVERQVALAAAILLLMLFEASVAMLTIARDEPANAWLYPAGFFCAYFLAIWVALTPAADVRGE